MKITKQRLKKLIKEEIEALYERSFVKQDAAKGGSRFASYDKPAPSSVEQTARARRPMRSSFHDMGTKALSGDDQSLAELYVAANGTKHERGNADAKAILDAVLEENPKLGTKLQNMLKTGEMGLGGHSGEAVAADPKIAGAKPQRPMPYGSAARPNLKEGKITKQLLKALIKEELV
jgi:hypothetical protein